MLDIYRVYSKQKQSDMAILISDKGDFRAGSITRQGEIFYNDEVINPQEDMTTLNPSAQSYWEILSTSTSETDLQKSRRNILKIKIINSHHCEFNMNFTAYIAFHNRNFSSVLEAFLSHFLFLPASAPNQNPVDVTFKIYPAPFPQGSTYYHLGQSHHFT